METNATSRLLTLVEPTDVLRLTNILQNAWRIKEIWDGEALANPGLWFMSHYTHPHNLLFDVCDGQGMIAFIRTVRGWRSQVYAAAWGRDAHRQGREAMRQAVAAAMIAHDLVVVDAFVREDNKLSQRHLERHSNFRLRGLVKSAQWYNGVGVPMLWYEADRKDYLGG